MNHQDCAAWLRERDDFLLLTHRNPDGDTLGSAAALCNALRRCGKRAFLYPNPEIREKLRPYILSFFAPEGYAPRHVLAVDVAAERMFPKGFEGPVDLCIDHHPSNTRYAGQLLLDGERAACGEAVLELIRHLCGGPDKQEADLLYIALSTDCGCFQYSNTDAQAFRDAAALAEAGADLSKWNLLLFRKTSPARIKLEGLIYNSITLHHEGRVVVALVTDEMLRQAGATEDDCDDLAGLAGRVEGGEVSITIRDWPGGASKVSVRSGESFDSCALCARFGGGGHRMASGCNLPVPPEKARELLLAAIDEVWA